MPLNKETELKPIEDHSLHFKFGLVKQFVKELHSDAESFQHMVSA